MFLNDLALGYSNALFRWLWRIQCFKPGFIESKFLVNWQPITPWFPWCISSLDANIGLRFTRLDGRGIICLLILAVTRVRTTTAAGRIRVWFRSGLHRTRWFLFPFLFLFFSNKTKSLKLLKLFFCKTWIWLYFLDILKTQKRQQWVFTRYFLSFSFFYFSRGLLFLSTAFLIITMARVTGWVFRGGGWTFTSFSFPFRFPYSFPYWRLGSEFNLSFNRFPLNLLVIICYSDGSVLVFYSFPEFFTLVPNIRVYYSHIRVLVKCCRFCWHLLHFCVFTGLLPHNWRQSKGIWI